MLTYELMLERVKSASTFHRHDKLGTKLDRRRGCRCRVDPLFVVEVCGVRRDRALKFDCDYCLWDDAVAGYGRAGACVMRPIGSSSVLTPLGLLSEATCEESQLLMTTHSLASKKSSEEPSLSSLRVSTPRHLPWSASILIVTIGHRSETVVDIRP
jgi:hypothetical protein